MNGLWTDNGRKILGELSRSAREARRLSREKICDMAASWCQGQYKFSGITLYNIENGKQAPTYNMLVTLSGVGYMLNPATRMPFSVQELCFIAADLIDPAKGIFRTPDYPKFFLKEGTSIRIDYMLQQYLLYQQTLICGTAAQKAIQIVNRITGLSESEIIALVRGSPPSDEIIESLVFLPRPKTNGDKKEKSFKVAELKLLREMTQYEVGKSYPPVERHYKLPEIVKHEIEKELWTFAVKGFAEAADISVESVNSILEGNPASDADLISLSQILKTPQGEYWDVEGLQNIEAKELARKIAASSVPIESEEAITEDKPSKKRGRKPKSSI